MNQILAIAIGGAVGAILRFFVSNGIYAWLGRGFPYGTLTVNIIGSFLIGLLTEALILHRVAIAMEYRAAILVGLFGSFTTFSTFSLDTLYLLEQREYLKAGLNVLASVGACLLAVWLGLSVGRSLFLYADGVIRWLGVVFPYAIVSVIAIGSFIIGLVSQILLHRVEMSLEHRAAILVVLFGAFATMTTLYIVLFLIEDGYTIKTNMTALLAIFMGNVSLCIFTAWLGLLAGRQI
ncbi:MAG: fluoride efflux transporter CrcB [Methylococcales bacterium]